MVGATTTGRLSGCGRNRGLIVLVAIAAVHDAGGMSSDSRRVALVAYRGVDLLDVVGPAEVMAGADRVVGDPVYAFTIATPDGRSARSHAGLRLEADCALGEVTHRWTP
jgi:transcriptional regulator GlxA family with amidase domain